MRRFAWLCALPGAFLVLGCAGTPPMMDESTAGEGYFFISGRFYDEPYNEVFDALKRRLGKEGYSLNRADKNAGIISTFSRSLEGMEKRHCECRRLKGFYELGRKVKMTFILTEISESRTQITVRSRYVAYWSDGRMTVERTCASDGHLEEGILRF